MKQLLFLVLATLVACTLSAQTTIESDSINIDSLTIEPQFSTPAAWVYVDHVVNTNTLWQSQQDPVRDALRRLLDHSMEPFDSIRSRLIKENFSLVEVHTGDPHISDSIELRWLNDSTFLVDPRGWSSELYLKKETRLIYPVDTTNRTLPVIPIDTTVLSDSSAISVTPLPVPDTDIITLIDTSAIESLGITMHSYLDYQITPSLDIAERTGLMTADRSRVLYYLPGVIWKASEDSPFKIMEGEHQLDSLQYAVNKLLEFTNERDSTILWVNDMYGSKSPFWLSRGDDEAYRFWVKNYNNDSITIWIGNPAPNEISLMLEDDVSINRLMKEEIHYLPEFVKMPERSLVSMAMLEAEPIYWNYAFGSAFTLNQTYLTNWTKGGESSFSTMIDLLGQATYNNKKANSQWINTMRLKFGTLSTDEKGFSKNHDLFEINSKFNRNAWGKIGMSASFYMKNQLAKGYDFPNDSVPVSKFLNPATLTVGLGFEYKPFKNTTINMAPLSYKNTFVLDTALIDQTKHGIEEGFRSKQEMGTQIVINNKISPFKDLTFINRIRLFSNYLDHPQNVDVDWELIMDQKINWFFTIRLNLHLIYDDDIRFTVLDSEGAPILLPDGSEKKVAKTQFKEFIGLSLQFKF
ncbi:MAG: DUF3078 domain-containing protein [Bacteroidales bacterium]|nr:DUF3078 domain-containing protein [Bacteroidales bacterium]